MVMIAKLDQNEVAEDLETMISKVNEDIELYVEKFDLFKKQNMGTLETVDRLLKPPENNKKVVTSVEGAASAEYVRFSAVPDLKPVFLDKEATMIDVNQWSEQFQNYISIGYRNNPPVKGVLMHIGPLVHSSWLQSLETKDVKNKSLDEITYLRGWQTLDAVPPAETSAVESQEELE